MGQGGSIKVAAIRFLCEQRGSPEGELKDLLSKYFKSELAVSGAFLLRVTYGDSAEQQVALCISGEGLDQKVVVENTSQIFRRLFNTEQSLDIIFLHAEQEREALKVGKPFYVQTVRAI